jgi:hypothetical protein
MAGTTGFTIRRPITTSGSVSTVDGTISDQLKELNDLFARPIFGVGSDAEEVNGKKKSYAVEPLDPAQVFGAELKPKRIRDDDDAPAWERDSLARILSDAEEVEGALSLARYVDELPELSRLKYAFDQKLRDDFNTLGDKAKTVLAERYPGLRTYLVVYAYHVEGLRKVVDIKNFVLNHVRGVADLIDYAVIGAARVVIKSLGLKVRELNQDDGQIVLDLRHALDQGRLSLSSFAFKTNVRRIATSDIFDTEAEKIIAAAAEELGPISPELARQLIPLIKASPFEITEENAEHFLPGLIADINGVPAVEDDEETDPIESERDFEVEFFEDDSELIEVSRSAVKCAAQLYYGMVLGDELDVFGVADYFTHKYLIRGGIDILDPRLRKDLQNYVFSGRFTDIETGELIDRTRPAERKMFYRQVFAAGHAEISDDVIVNEEFPRLWKILMLESAQYLERAQISPHPDNFVSRQKIQQAVEDTQYNLSEAADGMPEVISPLIYAELNFVIRRIFMHREVLRQMVPVGGTWWRVVEKLYAECKHARPKATVLHNKAKLGHDIIRAIAEYDPATFEQDETFSAFISNVDAFITTQSILQEALTDSLKEDYAEEEEPAPVPPPEPVAAAMPSNGAPPADEWDF